MGKIPERVSVGERVLYQAIGEELVLLNFADSQYYGLDAVGADVWRLLGEHRRPTTVVEKMAEIYDADPVQIRGDVEALISELLNVGLLTAEAS
jgi:hypothetical protein